MFAIPVMAITVLFLSATTAEATFNICQIVPQLCSSAPSASPSSSPEVSPSPEASASATVSPSPSEQPQKGCCTGTSGESFTNDGKPTYDPNRSDRGGKDPVIPKAAPATGFGSR